MRLPPLPAVRCFDAVARHLSVRRAAAELCVTPGAVSQQLRKLEDFLGCHLLERLPRGLALTPAGRDYHAVVGTALARIAQAGAALPRAGARVVRVSCTPGFAAQWLVPRLQPPPAALDGLDLQLNSTDRLVDLVADGVHFAVRHGVGPWPGLRSEVLLADELIAVCSPRLVAPRSSACLADLQGALLLHDGHRRDWPLWCQAHGAAVDARQGLVFVESNGALEAALAGRGFALVRRSLVARELATRALVGLQAPPLATPLAYHLVYPPSTAQDPALRRVRDWFHAQVQAD